MVGAGTMKRYRPALQLLCVLLSVLSDFFSMGTLENGLGSLTLVGL